MAFEKHALITDFVHPCMISGLKALGYHATYAPGITLEEVHSVIPAYSLLVINTKVLVDRKLLVKAKRLNSIARLGSGLDRIDVAFAESSGIKVFSAPEGNRNAVAEHAFGMLLMLMRKLHLAHASVSRGEWQRERYRGRELQGLTVGIIGFGNTGSSFARKFAGWETQVMAHDKYKSHFAGGLDYVKECGLREIQENADVISFHVPLTDETFHLGNAAFFHDCKHGAYVINTSRGAVMDTISLVNALETGHLGGACLDVLENEKPWTHGPVERSLYERLYAMENVVMSPHIAGWTVESKRKIAEVLLQKLRTSGVEKFRE